MKREIQAVLFYLKRLLEAKGIVEADKLEQFVERLAVALEEKFHGHWYPERPSKGSAYRCIRVNQYHREDPELVRACQESGVQYGDLGLPREITLWVDPGEVYCRYGEENLGFSVATFSDDETTEEQALKRVSSYEKREKKKNGPCHFTKNQARNPEWHSKRPKSPVKRFYSSPPHGFRPHSRAPFSAKRRGGFHHCSSVRRVQRGV